MDRHVTLSEHTTTGVHLVAHNAASILNAVHKLDGEVKENGVLSNGQLIGGST
jgi:hypothetical protein